MIGRGEVK